MRKTRIIQMKSIGAPDPVTAGALIARLIQKEKSPRESTKGTASPQTELKRQ